MEWFVFIVVVVIIYYIARRFSKKEAKQFIEEHQEPTEAENIESLDITSQVIVTFRFKNKSDQFMINSFANISINNTSKYKLIEDEKTLKLPPNFSFHFGVPYLRGEAFKADGSFNLVPGNEYVITFKPGVFVFQKAKVTIEDLGPIR